MTDENAEAPPQQLQPMSMNIELPQDLLALAAEQLRVPPPVVAQVLANTIGQMVMRGLGVRVGPAPQQSSIAIARGMPPAGVLPRGLRA